MSFYPVYRNFQGRVRHDPQSHEQKKQSDPQRNVFDADVGIGAALVHLKDYLIPVTGIEMPVVMRTRWLPA
jgi:hypothetical protein